MYKKDLALNNLQWLIYHKNKPNKLNKCGISTDTTLSSQVEYIDTKYWSKAYMNNTTISDGNYASSKIKQCTKRPDSFAWTIFIVQYNYS